MIKLILDTLIIYLVGVETGIMLGIYIGITFHKEIKKILTRGKNTSKRKK